MRANVQDLSPTKSKAASGVGGGGGGSFLAKSIRALHVSPSKHAKAQPSSTSSTAHRRRPTEDSLAVQISADDEQEIAADEATMAAAHPLLFAPRHRRTITPMGGIRNNTRTTDMLEEEEDGDTCSSGYLPSSMNVLPSNATMASSSSGSPDRSNKLTTAGRSTGSSSGNRPKSSKKQSKTKFALLSSQPLPRLGNDASKHSTRNISTEVLADADESTSPIPPNEPNIKAERKAYYDSLALSRNDVAYAPSTASSFFGGVLARDGANNAMEFRLPAADGNEGGGRYQASIFRSNDNKSGGGMRHRRSSHEAEQHCSDFDIMHLSGPGCVEESNDDGSSIRQTGSFDTLVSRDRSFHLGPLRSLDRSSGAAASATRRSSRSFLSDEDNHSISNLTNRSGLTTGSIETVQHSNKAKRGAKHVIRLRKIADRVKPIDEDGGESTDSDHDNDGDNDYMYGESPSKKSIPKVLRKTGTKIKRALREVAGNGNKSRSGPRKGFPEQFANASDGKIGSRPRGRLGSEPGIQLNLDGSSSSNSDPYGPARDRTHSADMRLNAIHPLSTSFHEIDAAIVGRRDGIDILDLGPARYQTIGNSQVAGEPIDDGPIYTPQRMVLDLLMASGGKVVPEIVFEGPSGEATDRWIVPVGIESADDGANTETKMGDEGDNAMPTCGAESTDELHELLPCFGASDDVTTEANKQESPPLFPAENSHPSFRNDDNSNFRNSRIWGKDPRPEKGISFVSSSCPVDVDEDVFIIESPEHLAAVHDCVASAIRRGEFGQALRVFAKLVRSLNYRAKEHDDVAIELLLASTHTNMAIICIWIGRSSEALYHINKATEKRSRHLPKNHSAIGVSFAKRGIIEFGLNNFEASLHSYRFAIEILSRNPSKHRAMLAKIENNIGCSLFQQSKLAEALKYFTASLELQRPSVEGSVRREAAVFNCGVTLTNLGKLYLALNDYEMAPYIYEEALLLQTSTLPKSHSSVLRTLESLAYTKSVVGDGKEALRIYKAVYRSLVAIHGESAQETIDIVSFVGALSVEQQSYGEALKCFQTLLGWQRTHLPREHPSIERTIQTIQKIEGMLNRSTV